MRIPRTQGCPPHCLGLTVIRSASFAISTKIAPPTLSGSPTGSRFGRPRELAAPPAHQEDGRKSAHGKALGSAERRSSFEATNVASELGQAEQALDFSEEVRQFAFEMRMPLARIDKMQELFSDQIFERTDKPEAMPYVARRVALRNPLPMKVSC